MTVELEAQRQFWNSWNAHFREKERQQVSLQQAEVVLRWLEELGTQNLRILEVGCGTGWLCAEITPFGTVVGTDLSDEVLERARLRWPAIEFRSGDFFALPFEASSFDVIISLEVLAHVEDQQEFIARVGHLLVPGGKLLLATQNRPVLEKHCVIPPPAPGQLRRWVDSTELAELVSRDFEVEELFSITPIAHKGFRRVVTSRRVNGILEFTGIRMRKVLEGAGWGWTLMLKARRKGALEAQSSPNFIK